MRTSTPSFHQVSNHLQTGQSFRYLTRCNSFSDMDFTIRLRLCSPLHLRMVNNACPVRKYLQPENLLAPLPGKAADGTNPAVDPDDREKAYILRDDISIGLDGVSLSFQKTQFSGETEKHIRGGNSDFSFDPPIFRATTLTQAQLYLKVVEKLTSDLSLVYVNFLTDTQMRRDPVGQRTSDITCLTLPANLRKIKFSLNNETILFPQGMMLTTVAMSFASLIPSFLFQDSRYMATIRTSAAMQDSTTNICRVST